MLHFAKQAIYAFIKFVTFTQSIIERENGFQWNVASFPSLRCG